MNPERHRQLRNRLVCLILAALVFQGCGLKADPSPRRVKPLNPVVDVQLHLKTESIVIRWVVPEEPAPLQRFKILRSESAMDGTDCPGCPSEETSIAYLTIGDPKLARQDEKTFSYEDASVTTGRLYRYRIIGCDAWGFCSEASRPVEVKTTVDGSGQDGSKGIKSGDLKTTQD